MQPQTADPTSDPYLRPYGQDVASPSPRQPDWTRAGLLTLLGATAALYLWGLGASGWGNAFYSAAAQAGSVSWKAFFFGSFDAGNSITVDKPPASLWLMALSVRLFGLSSWSILVPEALCGVAAVGVLYATVRRWSGPVAGLIAGAVMALTPVAVLMFRFNNPDALLVLLMVLAAYATVRAVESGHTRWLVLAGALLGFGFLTKMLQVFLVVPALALTYLVAAPEPLRRRIRQVSLGGLAMLVALGWWVSIVELVPASWRPYIGGSQSNSILELTFGYNGFGRITGDEVGSVVAGGPARSSGGMWGATGLTRLFDAENGGQVSWLLPAALILLVAGLAFTRGRPRSDRTRAGFLLWGGWLVVTALTFSLMAGIFHPYYSVALAPAIGGVVGTGVTTAWRRRDRAGMLTLAAVIAVTAIWSAVLLRRSSEWLPWLTPLVLVVGLGAAVALVAAQYAQGVTLPRAATVGLLAAGLGAGLAGQAAYAFDTAATPHTGSIPSAGPAVDAGLGRNFAGGPGNGRFGGQAPNRQFPGGQFGGPGGQFGRQGGPRGGLGQQGRGPQGAGGLLDATTPGSDLVAALTADAGRYTWVAATIGANNAAGYQLATQRPVMPIGGFNGSDPAPTLEEFQQYVAAGRIHYFIGSGGFRASGGSSAPDQIARWVSENFAPTIIDGVTVYDLSTGAGRGPAI